MLGQHISASSIHRTFLAISLALAYSPTIFAAPSKFLPTDLDTRNHRAKLQGTNTCGGNLTISDPSKRIMCLDPYENSVTNFCDGLSKNKTTLSGTNQVTLSQDYDIQHGNQGCPTEPYTINLQIKWVGNATCSSYAFSDTSWDAGTCKGTFRDMINACGHTGIAHLDDVPQSGAQLIQDCMEWTGWRAPPA